MLKFVVQRSGPPGGMYFYELPETKVVFQHPSMRGLLAEVGAHYRENDIKCPENLEALVQDFMCRMLPVGFCTGDDEGRARRRVVTLGGIRDATFKLAAGNPRVEQGEAERRSIVCFRCPLNDRVACTSCTGITAWARKLAGKSLGGLDSALGICQVDGIALSAKVHLSEIPGDEAYPKTCWRNSL